MPTPESIKWKNWHRSINVGGQTKVFRPNWIDFPVPTKRKIKVSTDPKELERGFEYLTKIVAQAETDQARVRAFGSKWSLNDIAFEKKYMVQSHGLNFCQVGLDKNRWDKGVSTKEGWVDPAYLKQKDKDPKHLCFVQCGVTVKALNSVLKPKELALPTTGASDGQTLVGAVSTGTHGSANAIGVNPRSRERMGAPDPRSADAGARGAARRAGGTPDR